MAKVIEFHLFVGKYIMVSPMDIPADLSGKYVSLAEYQRLQDLLKRWDEIATDLCNSSWTTRHHTQSVELIHLIVETSEVLK